MALRSSHAVVLAAAVLSAAVLLRPLEAREPAIAAPGKFATVDLGKIFDRLNLVNASAQTVEIAQRTLSAICHATGRLQVQDSADLHLIPMIADVTVKPPKNGYGESNKVIYLPLERGGVAAQPRPVAAAAPSGPAQPASAATPAVGFASAPWKRTA